jgi:uncharacterized protein (TIGR00288 family)
VGFRAAAAQLESFVSYPHRPVRAAENVPHAPHAALLIDFDNVTLGIRSDLTKELRTLLNSDIIKGKVAVQRAYADWRRYPQYIAPLSASSIDLIFAPAFGTTKKNATDIRLAIDAIELIFTRPEIGTFIIMSGDSDFSTMVIKLKEYGKYVIGVGIRESASELLIQNCDEYYSYSDLAGLTKESETATAPADPWELTRAAVAQMARNGDVMRSDRLKQVMQQLDPNFDERNVGYGRFSRFVLEAGQKGLLKVTKLDNGQFEVAPVDGAAPAAATPAIAAPAERERDREEGDEGARRSRRGRRRGGRERERGEGREAEAPPAPAARAVRADGSLSLARAFELMSRALSELRGGPVPAEALRLRMSALHGRDDALLESSRFNRLLRQANDAEMADVRKVGDSDELEVSLHRRDDPRARHGTPSRAAAAEPAASPPAGADGEAAAPAAPRAEEPARMAGQPLGLRYRRGSRGPARMGEIPLIGMVAVDAPEARPAPAATPEAEPAAAEAAPARNGRATKGRGRGTRARASKAATAEPAAAAAKPEATPATPAAKPRARRSPARPRAKKKPTE